MLSSAVERQLEILGESLSKFREFEPEAALRISDLRLAVDMRSSIIHGYWKIDAKTVLSTAQDDMPLIREQILSVYRDFGGEPRPETSP